MWIQAQHQPVEHLGTVLRIIKPFKLGNIPFAELSYPDITVTVSDYTKPHVIQGRFLPPWADFQPSVRGGGRRWKNTCAKQV